MDRALGTVTGIVRRPAIATPDMHRALTFFSQFEDTYRDWLLDNAEQHQYLAAQELRHMGELPTHLYVVLDGMLGIYQVHADGRRDHVGRAGPGQMLGELDWLNSVPVWTTVIAEEPSLIMSWSLEALERMKRARLVLPEDLARYVGRHLGDAERVDSRDLAVATIEDLRAYQTLVTLGLRSRRKTGLRRDDSTGGPFRGTEELLASR